MSQTGLDDLLLAFQSGQRGALARLLTLVENNQVIGLAALKRLFPQTGDAHILGITGPPGAGKSTLVNAMIQAYRAAQLTVAVLAIDPSSSLSGGAALGDRIRMLQTWDDDGVYVRSMATRGHLGGLARAIFGAVHLLDAFGFDVICIETVGVGQGEVDIAQVADTTILLQVPGLGDGVQLIKAGVLEIADIIVANKIDLKGADQLIADLRSMVRSSNAGAWRPPIVPMMTRTSDMPAQGIDRLMEAICQHQEHLRTSAAGIEIRKRRSKTEIAELVVQAFETRLNTFLATPDGQASIEAVAERSSTPQAAADNVFAKLSPGCFD